MISKAAILGGQRVRSHPFPMRRTMGEAEKDAALRVIQSDTLSGFLGAPGRFFDGGKNVREFERVWADRYGFKHAISVNSWTSGLVAAIGSIGIGPGDEVICSPYTMSASSTCALFFGGIPVFADIDPDTYCLDPVSIESCITPRTRAIVVVHLFGFPADMDAILSIARRHHLKVIEDAAQAPGVFYKGRPVGAIGDLGGFSLNYHKHIHTGEGGMIVTQNDDLAMRCRLIRNHGENAVEAMNIENPSNLFGGNYRLTELQAAIGIEQFKTLEGHLSVRQKLAERLAQRLCGMPGLSIQRVPAGCTHAYYAFPIRYDAVSGGLPRSLFVQAVLAELPDASGYETTPLVEGYVKPTYLCPLYQKQIAIGGKGFPFNFNAGITYNYSKGICPVTERMYEREMIISPLVHEPLIESDMDDLANAIEKVIQNAGEIRDRLLRSHLEEREVNTPMQVINRSNVR